MLFYGIYNELIIIRLPFKKIGIPVEQGKSQRKTMKLTYWNGDTLLNEEKELLFSTNRARTLYDLTSSWLAIQEEEQLLPKKISLQSVMLDASGHEAFISFDRSPFAKGASIHQKLLWVESFLTTIKQNGLPIKTVRLLVYAKPLSDIHLDFSHPWPIEGYSNGQFSSK